MRDASIISGTDRTMTAHAYTDTMRPVVPSSVPKVAPMSVSKPTGMNSDVLKMKAETVIPSRGKSSRGVKADVFLRATNPL